MSLATSWGAMSPQSTVEVRLRIKILPYADASTKSSHSIEEIAQCAHAENANRAGNLSWIGVGVVVLLQMRQALMQKSF